VTTTILKVRISIGSRFVLAASYSGGSYGVWPIQADGSLGKTPVSFKVDTGSGPLKDRQADPHPHEIVLDNSGMFAIVPDLGIDKWMQYSFDEVTGILTPNNVSSFTAAPPGAGPRHITFHPSSKFAYAINEMAASIIAFTYDELLGTMTPLQTVSTIANPTTPPSYQIVTAAEVHVSRDGQYLYASTRYSNGTNGVLTTFKIDQVTGKLAVLQYRSTEGLVPRYFTLDPDPQQAFVLVANQGSNAIQVFKRDRITGLVGATVASLTNVGSPTCIVFI